jgi:hypothetical protein
MKTVNFLKISIASMIVLFFGTTLSAQSISINTSTARKAIDEKTFAVTLNASGFSTADAANDFAGKMKIKGVHDVKAVNYSGNSAEIVITLPKNGYGKMIQSALEQNGIATVNLDGKVINTSDLVATVNASQKK